MKWNTWKIHRSNTLLKKFFFSKTLQSSKCIQIVLIFRAWVAFLKIFFAIQYLRKFDFLNFKLTYLAWKNNREPIWSRKQLGKIENLHSWNSLFKNLNFKTLKLLSTSKNFKAQIVCLKNSIVSQTDPIYELNGLTSKLQSWNSLLGNFKLIANWSSLCIEFIYVKAS